MYPFHLLNALESMAEMFTRFGGHRHAAGVSLPATRVPELRERLHEYSARHFRPEDFQRTIEIDALVDFRDVNDHTIRELIALGPFGFGNPAPLVAVIGAQLGGVRRDEKSTSVILRHSGKSIVAKTWNGVSELAPGSAVDAAICFEPDQFSRQRGLPGWSAMLKDIRPCIS
jgi:single-stranded-DNA-specific exonuclease